MKNHLQVPRASLLHHINLTQQQHQPPVNPSSAPSTSPMLSHQQLPHSDLVSRAMACLESGQS